MMSLARPLFLFVRGWRVTFCRPPAVRHCQTVSEADERVQQLKSENLE